MFSFRPYAISAGALIAVAASVNSSYAQQSDNGLTLEEVVVTAQKNPNHCKTRQFRYLPSIVKS